jgi:hypothetical protein
MFSVDESRIHRNDDGEAFEGYRRRRLRSPMTLKI